MKEKRGGSRIEQGETQTTMQIPIKSRPTQWAFWNEYYPLEESHVGQKGPGPGIPLALSHWLGMPTKGMAEASPKVLIDGGPPIATLLTAEWKTVHEGCSWQHHPMAATVLYSVLQSSRPCLLQDPVKLVGLETVVFISHYRLWGLKMFLEVILFYTWRN
jgi:hypothetical protein